MLPRPVVVLNTVQLCKLLPISGCVCPEKCAVVVPRVGKLLPDWCGVPLGAVDLYGRSLAVIQDRQTAAYRLELWTLMVAHLRSFKKGKLLPRPNFWSDPSAGVVRVCEMAPFARLAGIRTRLPEQNSGGESERKTISGMGASGLAAAGGCNYERIGNAPEGSGRCAAILLQACRFQSSFGSRVRTSVCVGEAPWCALSWFCEVKPRVRLSGAAAQCAGWLAPCRSPGFL